MWALIERLPRIASHVKRDFGELRPELKDRNLAEIMSGAAGQYTNLRLNPSLFAVFDHESRELEVVSATGELAGEGGRTEFIQPYPSELMQRVLLDWQSVHMPDLSAEGMMEVELVRDEGKEKAVLSPDDVLSVLPKGFKKKEGAMLLTPLGIEGTTPLAFGFIQEYSPLDRFFPMLIDDARDLSAFFTWQIVEKYATGSGFLPR